MPDYIYRCKCGREDAMTVPMLYSTAVLCLDCGGVMHRRPLAAAVNWGGLKPSQGELSPNTKRLLATADERRDRHFAKKEGNQ